MNIRESLEELEEQYMSVPEQQDKGEGQAGASVRHEA